MPSYESRITTSKLLIELENYEVINVEIISQCISDCFLGISNVYTHGNTVAFSLEHWYSPEVVTADTCLGTGCPMLRFSRHKHVILYLILLMFTYRYFFCPCRLLVQYWKSLLKRMMNFHR